MKHNWIKAALAAASVSLAALFILIFTQFADLAFMRDKIPALHQPKIVVNKSDRTLELYDGENKIKTYRIALGSAPVGDKEIEGDGKTPEGDFYIFTKNADSKFYLSLGVSYPSKEDAVRGLEKGMISREEHDAITKAIDQKSTPLQKTKLGGEIYIHGFGNLSDWTEGCVAMTNDDIRELFDAVETGTRVTIKP